MRRTFTWSLVAALSLAGTVACGGGGDTPSGPQTQTPTVQSVTVSPGTASLTAAGQTTTLTAEVRMSNGTVGTQTPT